MPRKGEKITARSLQGLQAESRANDLTVTGGSGLRKSGRGTALDPGSGGASSQFWARLSGMGPTYSFVEVSATLAPRAGGRTGEAYEVKNRTGLSGKIARIYDEDGSYRLDFYVRNQFAPPCGTGQTVGFTLSISCLGIVPVGAVCTVLSGGVVLGTCTYPSSGGCSVAVNVVPGTILDYEITYGSYPTKTGTVTAPECGLSVPVVANIWSTDDYPATLYVADSLGNAIPISASGSGPSRVWTGTHIYSVSGSSGPFDVTITFRWGYVQGGECSYPLANTFYRPCDFSIEWLGFSYCGPLSTGATYVSRVDAIQSLATTSIATYPFLYTADFPGPISPTADYSGDSAPFRSIFGRGANFTVYE